jgi:DnaK suppressor protein
MDFDGARAALKEERQKLVRQLEELGASESGDLRSDFEFGDGFADAGAATAERTEVLGLIETLKGQLVSVDQAFVKLDNGTYGFCDRCGRQIPSARLEARPASILCFDCKSQRR